MKYPLQYMTVAMAAFSTFPSMAQSIDSHPAVARAVALLKSHPNAIRLADNDRIEAFDLVRDADGTTHVRFDRRYKGLRVIGGDLIVHMSPKQRLKSVSRSLVRDLDLAVIPSLEAARAKEFATQQFDGIRDGEAEAELVIYAHDTEPVLAWDVSVRGMRKGGMPADMHMIVSAHGDALLDQWNDIKTVDALGSGTGLYTGVVPLHGDQLANGSFQLVDATRGGQTVTDMQNKGNPFTGGKPGPVVTDADNVWGNGAKTDRNSAAVDAAYGVAMTWDYYLKTFNRNGIKNDGKGAQARVHWGKNIVNASWDDKCFCMRYGDGDNTTYGPLVSLDVAGHEMTHGVTSATAKLIYSKESGGLNESMSDVFGTMVEYFANNPNSPPNYKIGERFVLDQSSGAALRVMYQPSLDGNSADCWYSAVGGLDVHYSSGVGNHAYYLLAEGSQPAGGPSSPTCRPGDQKQATGNAVLNGIGRDAAQKIWYRALSTYLTQSSNYAAMRAASISASTDIFGATSATTNAVKAAWSAVNVN